MSLREVPPKVHYISGVDDLVNDFYIPTLEKSSLYQRRTGYFNSRALAMASRGLSGLLKNNGHMQLICSVELDEEEREVYEASSRHQQILKKKADEVAEMLERPYDELERDRLALLAELLSHGLLEIKIAWPKVGIYHEKVGIMKDDEGNVIAFSGSDNETPGGWENNTESFHAFTSWEDMRHVAPEVETFDALWGNRLEGTTVVTLPEAVKKGILRYKRPEGWSGVERPDPPAYKRTKPQTSWGWTPEIAYIVESPRLWNHADFAFGEVGITPFEHQDYVAASVLKQWPPRCMLCDEVGLGKTIEAGLILNGFMQAGRLNRVLILAPKNILKQWQLQLLSKFNITSWLLDGDYVYGPQPDPNMPAERLNVDATNPFCTRPIMLVGSELIKREERRKQLLNTEYDLVFLDEAHHARAGGPSGRRSSNKLLEAMEQLKVQTQGLIFMTATPIQLDRKELWDLLMILELPGRWQDEEEFDRFYREINGNHPDWGFLFSMVKSGLSTWEIDEVAIVQVQRNYPRVDVNALMQRIKDDRYMDINRLNAQEVEALKVLLFRHAPSYRMIYRNTRELLKKYHKEGKFKERIADREPQPPDRVTLAGDENDPRSEAGLYKRIDRYVTEYYAKYNDVRKGLGFVMEVYRKRLTSSFYAIRLSLERRRNNVAKALEAGDYGPLFGQMQLESEESEDEGPIDEYDDALVEGKLKGDQGTQERMRKVLQAELDFLDSFVSNLSDIHTDSKFHHLERMLRQKLNSGVRRVIIFSQFSDTVDFLLESLRPIYGEKLGSYTGEGGAYWYNGQWTRCSRQKVQEKFRDDRDPLGILVCTDAASEGLDLQSCNTLINYDLPWNPMRIEQRIGRVDRIGQKSSKVYIHSLYYLGTVEEDVYRVCLERLDLFRSTLGHIQPVLLSGEVEKIIRRGAMARTEDEREQVLQGVGEELNKSIAEVEENIRIFDFLNQYTPQLQLDRKEVPVSQADMEEALSSHLDHAGWNKQGDYWERGGEVITFDPKVIDQRGEKARLITPNSEWASVLGNFGPMPCSIHGDGLELCHIDMGGLSGFLVKHSDGWHIVSCIGDIRRPTGQAFTTKEDAEKDLRYRVCRQRLDSIRLQEKVWRNRLESWNVRVRIYLDRVLSYVWKERGTLLDFDEGTVRQAWTDYLKGPDKRQTNILVKRIGYSPTIEIARSRTRGRPMQSSPRNKGKEESFLKEHENIIKQIAELKKGEKELLK